MPGKHFGWSEAGPWACQARPQIPVFLLSAVPRPCPQTDQAPSLTGMRFWRMEAAAPPSAH